MINVKRTIGIILIIFFLAACGEDDGGGNGGSHTHTWGDISITATCTTAGYATQTCAACSETKQVAPAAALGHHTPGGTSATCTTNGSTGTGICNRSGCGEEIIGETIPAYGHIGLSPSFAATCTAAGNSQAHGTCIRPGCSLPNVTGTVTTALGHQGLIASFAATCTAAGNSEAHGTCTRSGCISPHVAGTVTPALGHEGLSPPISATCTTAGNSQVHGTCSRCSHNVAGTVTAALGHLALNWVTYNSSNGYVSCNHNGCTGRLAEIGENGPGGGKIFYVASSGFNVTGSGTAHYMEATSNQGLGIMWSPDYVDVTGATGTIIGTGKANTAAIIAAHPNDDASDNAAKAAAAYNGGGKSDWFLPSKNELFEVYSSEIYFGITNYPFWTSSQDGSDKAWMGYMDHDLQMSNWKNNIWVDMVFVRAF